MDGLGIVDIVHVVGPRKTGRHRQRENVGLLRAAGRVLERSEREPPFGNLPFLVRLHAGGGVHGRGHEHQDEGCHPGGQSHGPLRAQKLTFAFSVLNTVTVLSASMTPDVV